MIARAARRLHLTPTALTTLGALLAGVVLLSAGSALGFEAAAGLRGAAVVLLVAAALEDLRTRRIRNTLVGPALALALLGAPEAWSGLGGALVAPLPLLVLAIAVPKAMGMGDVKLAAVAGALVGLSLLPSLWVAIAVVGGVLAVLAAIRGGWGATFAYGPAIALGALATFA